MRNRQHFHSGTAPGLDTGGGIFDHQALVTRERRIQAFGDTIVRGQKRVGCRFSVLDVFRRDDIDEQLA